MRRDAVPDVVLNQLYRFTALQSSFGANMGGARQRPAAAIEPEGPATRGVGGVPRAGCLYRRTLKHLLGNTPDGAHVPGSGLAIAVANIDEMIKPIRAAKDAHQAREQFMERDWPARNVAAMVTPIDDPRHSVSPQGTTKRSA